MQYLQPNTLLQGGKYRISRFLSCGGFGNTYEGIHILMDTQIAIKEFFPKMFCNRDENTSNVTVATQGNRELVNKLRKKFNEEAKAVFKMKHDNIVRVLDIFEENGTSYYVMEYIDGKSLNDITKERGALPEAEAVGYIRQIADALRYVHSLNRLHLDIKPGNIMIDKNGKAILIDFGASKHYDDESGENTSTLMGVNTKGYAPIEQSTQSFSSFSPATDIYALGATLYKLLTGIVPPDAQLLLAEEETLQPLPNNISSSTRNAVMSAMALRRKDRLQSVDVFVNILNDTRDEDGEETVIVTVVDDARDVKGNDVPSQGKNANLTFNVKGVEFKMIRVEGGTFDMKEEKGLTKASKKSIVQPTTLTSYYIGEVPVAQLLWEKVMGYNPSVNEGDNRPVENVTWDECVSFCRKIQQLTGRDFRLPTEAEWEFAARGGNLSKGTQYSGSENPDDVAWTDSNSNHGTHDVATKTPNELGIYDMSGNVWEWCSDYYGEYHNSQQVNPQGPADGQYRVYRGGSWCYDPYFSRVMVRNYNSPDKKYNYLGLRLALSE